MSSLMAAISLISPTDSRFAAADVISGATTNPTITKTASRRPMSRRRFITQHHTRRETLEGAFISLVRQPAPEKALKAHMVNWKPSALSDTFRAEKVHKGLSAVRTEEDDVVPPVCPSLHSRRSGRHARDG